MNRQTAEEKIKDIIFRFLDTSKVKVYLFGSRASKNEETWSDFDIGLLGSKAVDQAIIGKIKEELELSNIPYMVDVVDLLEVDKDFRKKALKDAILWKVKKK